MSDPSTKRNVLVTGGTRGLGLATCRHLAEAGYHVIATGRKPTEELAELVAGGDVRFVPLDLCQIDQIRGFIREAVSQHGPLYGLINNAALGHDGVLATMHDSQIEELLRVNVLASILVTKYASRSMLSRRTGRIVNVASIIASTGFSGLSVYAATKSSMIGLTKSLSRELGKAGITVNAVSPGYMATDMTAGIEDEKLATITRRSPLSRLATTDEVAAAIGYLLSDAAASITGTNLTIDAGSTA
ncbi:SDR family NAD(P)-dependent oxidoreductase [Crateriforma spongiae]|uniref:SDR family NAD(P)-dependent oxidoreductase n=1 Tax=Crateriforma spongiae TaxID=2724528 RepID=UPI0039B05724